MLTVMQNILDTVSQGLLGPVMAVLIIMLVYGGYCIGSIIAEAITERRHYSVQISPFLKGLDEASLKQTESYITKSGLLKRQKEALLTLLSAHELPYEARFALAKKTIDKEARYYKHKAAYTDTVARIAPMFGLMGTLIPLGPGVLALGYGDTVTLANSISIAFNTTVAGLIVAAVCVVITKIRTSWYDEYIAALDACMTSLLEKIEDSESLTDDFDEPSDGEDYFAKQTLQEHEQSDDTKRGVEKSSTAPIGKPLAQRG